MNTPRIQIVETAVVPDEVPAQLYSHSGFRVFSRILDWITSERLQLLNITDRINEIVWKSAVKDGLVHLQSLHTTASVLINEWDEALLHDAKRFFEQLVIRDQYYRHTDPDYSACDPTNANSPIPGMLM